MGNTKTRIIMSELKDRLDFAVRAATEAGQLTTRYFRSSDLTIETKPDETPVTQADKESEETLRDHLAKEFPKTPSSVRSSALKQVPPTTPGT